MTTATLGKVDRRKGELNHQSTITERDVREIRRLYDEGSVTLVTIAQKYGVVHMTISRIGRRQTWRHVAEAEGGAVPAAASRRHRGERCHQSKLTERDVRDIRRLYETSTLTTTEIAAQFDVSQSNVTMIGRRQRWAHVPEEEVA